MTGHIRRRGTAWQVKYDVTPDATGRRVTRYLTVRGTKKQAQEALTRLLSQRDQGTLVEPTKMTVGEYLRHWLEVDIDRRLLGESTGEVGIIRVS